MPGRRWVRLPTGGRPRSIAVRVTLLATALTAGVVVLLLAGVLALFVRQLDVSVDDGLAVTLAELRAGVAERGPAALSGVPLAELYEGNRAVATSPAAGGGGDLLPDRDGIRCPARTCPGTGRPGSAGEDPVRIRVRAGCLPDGRVLAVAVSLQPQIDAAERLLVVLALAAPVLLAVVAAVVHRAVHAALRPVDALTRRAAEITAGPDTAGRMPTVDGDDEVARLARTLGDMLERLHRAFTREQAFVDDASHELRTPLTVLRGELELALSDLADSDEVERSLRAALAEAHRLGTLADDLLALARERQPAAPQASVDLAEVLSGGRARLAAASATAVTVSAATGPLPVLVEPAALERVLGNLVTNAAAAGAGRVRLSAARDGDEVVLVVEDDGPGFPVDFLPSAFERFSRPDAARTRGRGAGLGLSLVAAVVEGAGGSVSADNAGGLGGAAVRLRLPSPPGISPGAGSPG